MLSKHENVSSNAIASCAHGAAMSGGSMSNPMYQNTYAIGGVYQPTTGRCKRRIWAKKRGETIGRKKQFWEL